VVELPFNVALVLVQLSALSAPALATGSAMSCVTATVSLLLQPLAGLVTVKV